MIDFLSLSVGIGIFTSLLFSEFFFLAPGGIIVPGYLALYVGEPSRIISTLGVALVTFVIVRSLSSFLILYGRRRTALMVLTSYVLGLSLHSVSENNPNSLDVVGFIIPGLIAIWFDRQGVLVTTGTMIIVTSISRLALILLAPGGL